MQNRHATQPCTIRYVESSEVLMALWQISHDGRLPGQHAGDAVHSIWRSGSRNDGEDAPYLQIYQLMLLKCGRVRYNGRGMVAEPHAGRILCDRGCAAPQYQSV